MFSRNLDKHRDHRMPWMPKVVTRLPARMKVSKGSYFHQVSGC